MAQFPVDITKFSDPDKTLDEVLKSIKFQNAVGNLLVSYQIQPSNVKLVYESK